MRTRNQRRLRRGFSLMEMLIVVTIIVILLTLAIPKYKRTQMYARETAAVAAIQVIHKVQIQYQSQYGKYATSLAELGPPQSGGPNPAAADLILPDLAAGEIQGYKITLTGNQGGYIVNAVPTTFNETGSRTFYSDQSQVVRQNEGPEPATAASKQAR